MSEHKNKKVKSNGSQGIKEEDMIYEKFIDWLGKTWWELPESDHLRPMIKANYTPQEAAFLTGFPLSAKPVEDIAAIKGLSIAELEEKLKPFARKGMVFKSVRNDQSWYRLNDSFMALLRANLWPGDIDERAEEAIPLINKYFDDGWFDQYLDIHYKGLRTLPIEKTIKDPRSIVSYEDVVKVVDSFEYYTVSYCPCRLRHTHDPDFKDCHHPLEVCLHFDELGRYIVESGQGREITKDETHAILKQAADSGLVHAISNWKDKPDTICNCCSCCCMFLDGYHRLGHPESTSASSYLVEIDASACKACALCVKRCPLDALQMKVSEKATNKYGKSAVLSTESCIGCGVCVHKCPTDSLKLVRKEAESSPPQNVKEYMMNFMKDKKAAKAGA